MTFKKNRFFTLLFLCTITANISGMYMYNRKKDGGYLKRIKGSSTHCLLKAQHLPYPPDYNNSRITRNNVFRTSQNKTYVSPIVIAYATTNFKKKPN